MVEYIRSEPERICGSIEVYGKIGTDCYTLHSEDRKGRVRKREVKALSRPRVLFSVHQGTEDGRNNRHLLYCRHCIPLKAYSERPVSIQTRYMRPTAGCAMTQGELHLVVV